jgi:hypothetical protein
MTNASAREVPHISTDGLRDEQKAGRSGLPKRAQRPSTVRFAQAVPAGLPSGIPGIGEVIDGATQQAAQPVLQSMRENNAVAGFLPL